MNAMDELNRSRVSSLVNAKGQGRTNAFIFLLHILLMSVISIVPLRTQAQEHPSKSTKSNSKQLTVQKLSEAAKTYVEKKSIKDESVIGLNIGNKAPELEYNSPYGKKIRLSSLKGKLVLIDFWASWCPPCRIENPALVKTYNKFKNKKFINGNGFTIYSVSLDGKKDPWIKAIKVDKLSWQYHVSDLQQWASEPAKTYGINSIPANYLIDADGIIIAKNLRGSQLDKFLAGQLKQ